MPITHFKCNEIGVSVSKLKELGYEKDIKDEDLVDENQMVELKAQDVILPACEECLEEGADKVFFRVSKFIDELLVRLYKEKSFYNLKKKEDLIGHLIISLAPHTSAGVVGRIIGFSKTQGFLAHPLYHAAHRRDCDGDEIGFMLLMDGLLNFSRQYLPDRRGGRSMDAPLVLSSKIIPSEVDDMVHGMDVVWKYPLELYEAAEKFKYPYEVKVKQLKDRLETEKEYSDFGYTHDVDDLNKGLKCSDYKLLPTMEEKVRGQMKIAESIRAVDEMDVAKLVIEKHFIRDIRGNLRKFSMQQFRCVKCNEKFRRPPLDGNCRCGGRIIFTISHGGIVKYLEPAIGLAEKYALPPYLKQNLELVKMRVESIFGKDPEKQEGLGKWV
jgi:DNA polymerase II large subunit